MSTFKTFLRMWREECALDKFKLTYDHPEEFTRTFWQKQQRVLGVWVIYRAFLVAFFAIALLVIFSSQDEEYPWYKRFLFFTYWTYVVELLAFVLALSIVVQRTIKEKKQAEIPPMEKMPFLYQVMWCLYTISAPSAFVVTVVFWLFIYSPDMSATLPYAILAHVFNSLFMFIDFVFAAIPYRFLHFYLPFFFGTIYVIFTIVYQLNGGLGVRGVIPLYTIMDWRYPKTAIATCTVIVSCLVLVHFILCLVYLVKLWVKPNLRPNQAEAARL